MKKFLFVFITLFLFSGNGFSQNIEGEGITIKTEKSVDCIIEEIIKPFVAPLKNKGKVESLRAFGDFAQIGWFSNGSAMGIKEGLVISSGYVDSLQYPNNNGNLTGQLNGGGDTDLNGLGNLYSTNSYSFDASGVCFYFTPKEGVSEIKFELIFGSENYNEFVPEKSDEAAMENRFIDRFGIFISGKGIEGPFSQNSENIATVPFQSDKYISLNTINCGKESSFGVTPPGYSDPSQGCNCNMLVFNDFKDNKHSALDAYTKPIMVKANLISGEKYLVKIVLGDLSDGNWDSGLFIRVNYDANNDEFIPNKVEDYVSQKLLEVYPNPAKDNAIVIVPSDIKQAQLKVYDIHGRVMVEKCVHGGEKANLSLNHIPSGIYCVIIEDGDENIYREKLQVR
ncbi:MAG: choice-of-anchor L domain-containing protein [Bacteroidales bacterium]